MNKITYIIIAAAIAIGGYTYYSNQQAKEVARVEAAAAEAAATAAAEAKAAEEAAAMAAEEAAAKAAEEAAAMAVAKAAEEAAAMAAEEAAAEAKRVAEEAAAKAAQEAAAIAKAAEEAAAAVKAAEEAAAKAAAEAAAMAAEEAAAAAKAAEEAAAMAAEEAAAKVAQEAAAAEAAAMEAAEAVEAATPMMVPPFGSELDVGFAGKIWQAMLDQNLAGPDMLRAVPYEGTDPHGMMLELFTTRAEIDGNTGDLIVKRNFGPEGVSADQVLENPEKHLGAITVMYRREAGFDPDTKDWFWVKFLPDGTVDKNPMGLSLAGKVAKGMDVGCIACHSAADGDDFVYSPGVFE